MRRSRFGVGLISFLWMMTALPAAGAAEVSPPPNLPLMEAVKKGDVKTVRAILGRMSPDAGREAADREDRSGETALTAAAEGGHLEIVQLLVEHGATVDAGKERGAKTPLIAAARQGFVKVVQYLLGKGADINARGDGVTALLAAGRNDDFPFKPKGNRKRTISALLEAGADVNVRDESWLKTGRTPLMYAVVQGDAALVQSLLARGARLDFKDRDGATALALAKEANLEYIAGMLEKAEKGVIPPQPPTGLALPPLFDAAREGDIAKVRTLVKAGDEVDQRAPSGSTPLMFAADGGSAEIVRYLLKNGADINAKNGTNNTALIFAAVRGHAAVVNELLRRKAEVNTKNLSRGDALIYAVIHNRTDVVRLLLKAGASLGETYDDGKTALIIAIQEGNGEIARMLIDRRAGIDTADSNGLTPLMTACIKDRKEMADALLRAGANVHVKAKDGETALDKAIAADNLTIARKLAGSVGKAGRAEALFAAAGRGNMEAVKLLLRKDTDVNMTGPGGETLLMRAAGGDVAMVRFLLEKGAAVNRRDADGRTALMKAVSSFDSTGACTVRALIDHGADPNRADKNGETSLILAAKRGRAILVATLLERGAAVSARDKTGKSALVYALEGGNDETAALLKKAGAFVDYKGMQWTGYVSQQKEPFIGAVEDRESWSDLWRRAFGKAAPDIDFNRYAVACVFLGYSADWLYAVSFGDPFPRGDQVVVPFGLVEMQLRLAGPFRASGQYAMKVFEKKPGTRFAVEETSPSLRRR